MRILHVIQSLACGGIERIVLSMLQKSYENTYIFVIQLSETESLKKWPIIGKYKEHILFANLELNGKSKTLRFLKETCTKLSVTTIHTHYTGPLLYATLATLGKKIPLIHTEHDSWHLRSWKNRTIEKVMFASKKTTQIVAVSAQIQSDLVHYFPHHQSTLIHNGIDTSEFRPGNKLAARAILKLPPSAIIIGCAGRLTPIKGHQYLIEALKQLPEKYYLTLAGEGPLLEALVHLAHQLKLEQRVHFCGLIENTNIFYQACDVFCLPSLDEGMPLALLEAQATNVPSICTDVGGCKEAMDLESGLLVAPKNPYTIAQACLEISKKEGNPREFIINNFSFTTMINKYNELYQGGEYGTFN